jgi:uncharacterized protein (TIRG00374 family)
MEKLGKSLVLAVALGLAVYAALFFFFKFGEVSRALSGFELSLIPVVLGLVTLSYAGRFVRWLYYLKVLKVSVPLGQNAAIFAAGLSMTISPGKLGEVLKSVFVRQVSGAPIARTAPAVVAERATDGTGMVLWGFIGAFALNLPPWTMLAFLGVAVFGIVVLRSKGLSLLAERVLLKLPLLDRLAPHLRSFHGASNELLGVRPLAVGTVISFLSWGLECFGVYLCAVGLGADAGFLMVVFVFAVSSQFVRLAGMPMGLAGALTFVIRLATLWWATLLGILGLLLVRRLVGTAPLESTPE